MKTILRILTAAGGWHHGLHLRIENPPYMALVIEATDESGPCGLPALSVCHYGEQNGESMRYPEMCFELGFAGEPHLNPFYYRNDYVEVEQSCVTATCTSPACTHSTNALPRCGTTTCDYRASPKPSSSNPDTSNQVSPPTERRQRSVSASPPQPPTPAQGGHHAEQQRIPIPCHRPAF
jgi:hypothetical protein